MAQQKTELESFDVQDTEKLGAFRRKREEWIEWLFGEDPHSILRQIEWMTWDYRVFRVLYDSRRLAARAGKPSAALNRMVAAFLDNGFVAMQALAIRKLLDPRKDVISLLRLVTDIKENWHLFTRVVFVGYDGCPFDTGPGEDVFNREFGDQFSSKGIACWVTVPITSGPNAWRHAERLHERFDRLSGCDPRKLSRADELPPSIICELLKLLKGDSIRKAKDLANKRIAHAADAASRKLVEKNLDGLRFADIEDAQRALVTIAGFVSASLLDSPIHALTPTLQYDLCEHLDAGWVREPNRLWAMWDGVATSQDQWLEAAENFVLDRIKEARSKIMPIRAA